MVCTMWSVGTLEFLWSIGSLLLGVALEVRVRLSSALSPIQKYTNTQSTQKTHINKF